MTTRKGCMLPPSSAALPGHRRPPPAMGKTTVSDEPPEDCAPIWVWAPGSSSPDVYLVRRKTPKSSALLPPPPAAPVATTEPAPAPEPEVYLVKRKTPKSALPAPAPAPAPDPDAEAEPVMKRCRHCASSTTPQWREGPEGPATLCNACGVRHRQGRLLPEYRPRASPSFEPGLHASRHSEVLRLHRQRLQRDRIVERRRRRRAPPPEQRSGSEDDDGGGLRVGGSSSGGSGSGGGDDEQLLQELPLPWRWHNSAGDPCPWCVQEQE